MDSVPSPSDSSPEGASSSAGGNASASASAESGVRPPPLLRFSIPFGLIGLRNLTRFELESIPDSPPFFRIRSVGEEGFELVVLEPDQFLEKYPMELSDEDALDLGVSEGSHPLVLNIVAIHSLQPQYVTVNLAAPLVINRETGLGKQVILGGKERYSVAHVLVDHRGLNSPEALSGSWGESGSSGGPL